MSLKIKKIKFEGISKTSVEVDKSEQPQGFNQIISDGEKRKSDLPRHADFERAKDKLKPHQLIASGLQTAHDYNGNYLDQSHFNDFFADNDEELKRFGGLELTEVIFGDDKVELIGSKITPAGEIVPVRTGWIPLEEVESGYSYELLEILDEQIDTLKIEAKAWYKREKHGAGMQTQMTFADTGTAKNTEKDKNKNLQPA